MKGGAPVVRGGSCLRPRSMTLTVIERLTLALPLAVVGIAILGAAVALSHGGRQEVAVFSDVDRARR
jgi:hypothetical protein